MRQHVQLVLFCMLCTVVQPERAEFDALSFFRAPPSDPGLRLRRAIKDANHQLLGQLLRLGEPVNKLDARGFAPLHYATMLNDSESVRLLIHYGASPDIKSEPYGLAPLHIAARVGYVNIIEALLGLRANIGARDTRNNTPLHYAARYGRLKSIKLLLYERADPLVVNYQHKYPYDLACKYGHNKAVSLLINQKSPSRSQSLLMQASMMGDIDRARTLLRLGADPLETDFAGVWPVIFAGESGNETLVQLLINRRAHGETVLTLISKLGGINVVRWLIGQGADLEARDDAGRTAVLGAAEFNQSAVVSILFLHGADTTVRDDDGNTMLHLVAKRGHVDIIHWLAAGFNFPLEGRNEQGQTPLHLAAQNGEFFATAALIGYKAKRNVIDKEGNTPMHYAAASRSPDIVKILIRNGGKFNVKNKEGMTPMHLAAQNKFDGALKYLLIWEAEVNAKNKDGETPLHLAVLQKRIKNTKELLEAGARVNARTVSGDTPLHYAAEVDAEDVVPFLVEAGADVNAINDQCQTPQMIAQQAGNVNFLRALIETQHGYVPVCPPATYVRYGYGHTPSDLSISAFSSENF